MDNRLRIQPLAFRNLLNFRYLRDEHAIGEFQRLGQTFLENGPARSVRPRLEYSPNTVARIPMTQRVQRLRDRGRMMPKIVDHFDAARFATHFLAARDTGKSFQ